LDFGQHLLDVAGDPPQGAIDHGVAVLLPALELVQVRQSVSDLRGEVWIVLLEEADDGLRHTAEP
jgi:hypothetical protein